MKKRKSASSAPFESITEADNSPAPSIAPEETANAVDEKPSETNEFAATADERRWDWYLISISLAIKAVMMLFAVQSYLTWSNKPFATWYGWLEIWNRWDSLRHIRLAQIGYTGVGSERADLIGFPLYPWLVRWFTPIFQDYLVSAFVVSGLALIAACWLLHKLVAEDFADAVARNSVWFMLIFPTAYYLHINYNESLFIALTLGCFLAARRGEWAFAGILGIFLCLTRFNGIVIVPALMVEAFLQFRASRRWQWEWLWIFAMPLGFVGYLLLNQHVAGDALAFLKIGKENFQKSLEFPWRGILGTFNLMWSPEASHAQIVGVQEFTFVVLGALGTVASAIWLRPSYTVWMFFNWLLFTCSGFILSVPRYTLIMFPIFILFAWLAERRLWFNVITVWSLLFFGLFVSKFIQGHWTF